VYLEKPRMSTVEAEDTVGVPSVPQHETVVTKVYNDMLMAAVSGQVFALCLLDLSAAFDTVDHDLLMRRLERQCGRRSGVLQWFSSYLSGRTFQVVYGCSTSPTVYIPSTVPQGSVLGPRLFILYTADWNTTSRNIASVSTRLQTTRSYVSTVVMTKLRPPSYDSRTALRKLATG